MSKVTVIMPAYNAEQYIESAIRSLQAQTEEDWTLMVMDDCSTDGTCAIVEGLAAEDPRILLFRSRKNLGAARSRNKALEGCKSEFVAFLDSDDLWHPEKLALQLERLEETGADLCYTSYAIIGADGEPARGDYVVPERVDFDALLRENVIGCSTVLLRRRSLGENCFTTAFYHEDYALWLRLLGEGKEAVGCTQVLAQWRYAADSRSFDKRRAAKNRWDIYRKYLGLSLPRSAAAFGAYAAAGLKKYKKG